MIQGQQLQMILSHLMRGPIYSRIIYCTAANIIRRVMDTEILTDACIWLHFDKKTQFFFLDYIFLHTMFTDFYKNMENSKKWYHFDYCGKS